MRTSLTRNLKSPWNSCPTAEIVVSSFRKVTHASQQDLNEGMNVIVTSSRKRSQQFSPLLAGKSHNKVIHPLAGFPGHGGHISGQGYARRRFRGGRHWSRGSNGGRTKSELWISELMWPLCQTGWAVTEWEGWVGQVVAGDVACGSDEVVPHIGFSRLNFRVVSCSSTISVFAE